MTDILADYREWAAEQPERIGTHSDRCHMWPRHERCMIHRLARALEAARLTDEERQAIAWVCGDVADITGPTEKTLRGLLERTKCVAWTKLRRKLPPTVCENSRKTYLF